MSNWEVKDLWSKSNGDLVLTVGPSIDSNEGMSAFLCISLYLLALWNLWPVHGAGALILGVIHVFLYVIACFAAFFVNLVTKSAVSAYVSCNVPAKTSSRDIVRTGVGSFDRYVK